MHTLFDFIIFLATLLRETINGFTVIRNFIIINTLGVWNLTTVFYIWSPKYNLTERITHDIQVFPLDRVVFYNSHF